MLNHWKSWDTASNDLFEQFQSGFSAEASLVKVTNDILAAADRELLTLIILDCTATFDTVCHDVLLARLKNAVGIGSNRTSPTEQFVALGRLRRSDPGVPWCSPGFSSRPFTLHPVHAAPWCYNQAAWSGVSLLYRWRANLFTSGTLINFTIHYTNCLPGWRQTGWMRTSLNQPVRRKKPLLSRPLLLWKISTTQKPWSRFDCPPSFDPHIKAITKSSFFPPQEHCQVMSLPHLHYSWDPHSCIHYIQDRLPQCRPARCPCSGPEWVTAYAQLGCKGPHSL